MSDYIFGIILGTFVAIGLCDVFRCLYKKLVRKGTS